MILRFLFLFSAGAAVGAAATANAGWIVAAGGAALSAGAGAVASAASALFSTVTGSGDGAASGASSGVPRPYNNTGTRPKRKVILILKSFSIFCLIWIMILVIPCSRYCFCDKSIFFRWFLPNNLS